MLQSLDKHLTTAIFAPLARRRSGHTGETVIPILMYHSVSNDPESGKHPYFWLNTTPERFEAQMRFLSENGYDVISLARAVRLLRSDGSDGDRRRVVITFDDGFRDFYFSAFPILRAHGFTATVFLPTNYISDHVRKMAGREHLSWNEVAGLHRQGISFGSHTANHLKLKKVGRDEIRFELAHSKQVIESKIGAPVESFSYPHAFPEENTNLTRFITDTLNACGYQYGVSTRIGRATAKDPVFFLKRLPVNSRDDLAFFRAKLEGGYDWLHRIQLTSKIIRAKLRYGKKRN